MLRVLVCDDEVFVRRVLAEYLRANGYKVEEAQNGVECIEKAKTTQPDAILLDLRMPKMDGNTALKKLREEGMNTPVFVLSGFAQPSAIEEAIELGAKNFIRKPYHLPEIAQLLQNTLHQ